MEESIIPQSILRGLWGHCYELIWERRIIMLQNPNSHNRKCQVRIQDITRIEHQRR